MLFNSIEFALFLPVLFVLYWIVYNKDLKKQNLLILVGSYTFYGWWDWRFLFLIFISSLLDYHIGVKLSKTKNTSSRKYLLYFSLLINLGLLGFFKYYNFFAISFAEAFTFFGQPIDPITLKIILPIGISFYTFQTLSYTIDIYKNKIEPTQDIVAFLSFVSFFPQLVAGPIERASNLLPQFHVKRVFNYSAAVNGLRQILWGLFKKIVIADNCAIHANNIFNNSSDYSSATLALGAIFFAFQIYGDFSGYSDIAIGTSRLFGFNLKQNFAYPYFSRDPAEFWRRWHISLSTWFRDYIYIPLGGSRVSKSKIIRNTFIVFLVSGFWHGANWTFIVWGLLNAIYYLPIMLYNKNRCNLSIADKGRYMPSVKNIFKISLTFTLITFSWIFFRADNLFHAIEYIKGLVRQPGSFLVLSIYCKFYKTIILLLIFIVIEWIGRENQFALEKLGLTWHKSLRLILYHLIIFTIYLFSGNPQDFIYFQF